MQIEATIDTAIRFEPHQLNADLLQKLLVRLRVPNPQKSIAVKEMLRGADKVPDHLHLYKFNRHNKMVFPRGFVHEFEQIITEAGHTILWDNKGLELSSDLRFDNVSVIPLRDYQLDAIDELTLWHSGIYKAPTGSGKTRVMLELIRLCGQPSIVFVEKTDIAKQWMDDAAEFGIEAGLIGEGIFWEADLTIALRQSVYAADLDQEWFNKWGMVVVDECHHCSAETMFELVQRFPAYYRFGCSATPDTDSEIFPIARAVLGPVVHETSPDKAQEALVIPTIRPIETSFEFDYVPTERRVNHKTGKMKVYRNNYNQMMTALENDRVRNEMIITLAHIEALEGHHCIVVSKRKKHLDNMILVLSNYYRGVPPFGIRLLTSFTSKKSMLVRKEIELENEGSILFSTLADEGTDIPRLDRLFLSYPGRKLRGFEQAIGRIMRTHPKKEDAIVYDFRDKNVRLLNGQYRERAQQLYAKKGYKVEQ